MRFKDISNSGILEVQFKEVWLGNFNLNVNRAKFERKTSGGGPRGVRFRNIKIANGFGVVGKPLLKLF